jgi:predicted transcriptional regulator
MTLKEKILADLKIWQGVTASEIANHIKESPGSVASALCRLVKTGAVIKTDKKGPKGGQCYRLPSKPRSTSSKTAWQHLLEEAL